MNMYEPCIPISTIRDVGRILIHALGVTFQTLADTFDTFRGHVEPPEDLIVVSSTGGLYSGVLVLRCNEVIAGAVFHAGQALRHSYPYGARRLEQGQTQFEYEEDEPWRR